MKNAGVALATKGARGAFNQAMRMQSPRNMLMREAPASGKNGMKTPDVPVMTKRNIKHMNLRTDAFLFPRPTLERDYNSLSLPITDFD